MDKAKVFKDYFVSGQNRVLIPEGDFGRRKFLHVGGGSTKKLTDARIEQLETSHYSNFGRKSIEMRAANKQWVHPAEALTRGHIVYNVKFLGETAVEQAKGTDTVKEAIRKRKFNKHIKKAEGQKMPKVELTISVDGVTVQDPRTKMVMHTYPLHRISYCADDKSDKRMVTFIAKAADSNKHFCYVFDSEKCAEEITLTIGQAFDLAYRRFLEQNQDHSGKKQFILLQKKVQALEQENEALKRRIHDLEQLKDREDLEQYKMKNGIVDMSTVPPASPSSDSVLMLDTSLVGESSTDSAIYSTPMKQTIVGRRLENLDLEESTPQTNGTASTNGVTSPSSPFRNTQPGIISPPPPSTRSRTQRQHSPGQLIDTPAAQQTGLPQATPVSNPFVDSMSSPAGSGGGATTDGAADPFGMGSFTPTQKAPEVNLEKAFQFQSVDQDFLDLQAGFSQGLSIGTGDFSLDDLDPLNQK